MKKHILILIDSYLTQKDPRRGAKYKLHLKSFADRNWQTGIVAIKQKDYSLIDCFNYKKLILEDSDHDMPIIHDCRMYTLFEKIPKLNHILNRYTNYVPLKGVVNYIKKHGLPDIVHAHGSEGPGLAAYAIHKKYNIPYVVTEHMTTYYKKTLKTKKFQAMRKVFSHAKVNLPISAPLGYYLENLFKESFRPWVAVPNMLEKDLFDSKLAVTADQKYSNFIFLSLSQLVAKKGFEIMLRAFATAFKGSSVQLRIGGDGKDKQKLINLAKQLDIGEQVIFLGYISRQEVANELNKASAYVCSSYFETFGIPVIEAFAAGIPVISTKCGGPESLINQKNGLLVPSGDVKALANAMQCMFNNIDTYDPHSIKAECIAKFSPDIVAGQLKKIYRSIIDK